MALTRLGLHGFWLLMGLPAAIWAQAPEITGCDHAPTYTPCDLAINLSERTAAQHPHPYSDVELRAEFRSPRGRTLSLPAFWDGGRRMVLRFSPTEPGEWQYKLTSNLTDLDAREGTFTAVATDSLGFIRPDNVHHWSYTERRVPHLWMGANEERFAFLADDAFHSVVDARAAQKFTHFRGLVMGLGLEPAYAGPSAPNLAYF